MKKRIWRIAGINFDHFHMGDLLRVAAEHPRVQLVGICDEDLGRMQPARAALGLSADQVFTDYRACLTRTRPDVVILCPAASRHGEWVSKVAPYGVHLIVEKPFAASLKEADAMVAAMPADRTLLINWPLQWVRAHQKAHQLITRGLLGDVLNVWHFGGNRGPLWHGAGKEKRTREEVDAEKPHSWFYRKQSGGGSLLDYLGYGTTLGTWFQGGRRPLEVTAVVDRPQGLEVDEHSIVVARYAHGLSKFETRWGTFSDPWEIQPQPRCGFIVAGTEGTLSCYDYDEFVTVQACRRPRPHPVAAPRLRTPHRNPVEYLIHCLETGGTVEGPVSLSISRVGQEMVDAAVKSAASGRTVALRERGAPGSGR
jgi:glucose-fructose oxidoreductase